jgi:hypothetical protein
VDDFNELRGTRALLHHRLAAFDRWVVGSPTDLLDQDPRIQRLETRRELNRTRTRWRLAFWSLVVVALGIAQWQVGPAFGVLLGVAAAALGVAYDRWSGASREDERFEQDLQALTTVYHESPQTIRKWLTREFIDDSIRNLLAAALETEELAHGYWDQGIAPFLAESKKGFKLGWRYEIDLADLEAPVTVRVPEGDDVCLEPARHRRLHTSVAYAQRIPNPDELYYVAVVFDGGDLPSWFQRSNFLLREVALLPDELIQQLPEADPALEALPRHFDAEHPAVLTDGPLTEVARQVLHGSVYVGEERLEPAMLHVDRSGISWGFRLSKEHRESLRGTAHVRVELHTFMARSQRHFPVVIAAPTRNPTVQFNYSLTEVEDIRDVATEVFFSAQRPWDARLRTRHEAYRRVEVITETSDWVFAGSGCVFVW